ncbi:hypothetical protein CAI21_20255 [Alkalilimnicola ehrlichii]|uniref:MAPEG family protein n=1 Tax=Alkalilimnicola ehrlichii TaxID=351052 RepID=A0A3E0WGH8_9GAMM|nr:MAPEG family protein [Alkalilimnicola ehrlichii]RFA24804.1 hypothetical protein CAI21_20255 [Alkalilimnicola ehrlichii]RFA32062.1 hypothetical protein CAL65_20715 [Alkalilimnicola ehrlichii]
MTIAYWCVLIVGLLPYAFAIAAKAGASGFNNRTPRTFLAGLEGWRKRADWVQHNTFEALPLFAAAVIIAHQLDAAQGTVNTLAVTFVILRIVYGLLYIFDKPTLRSLIWFAALICVIALFFVAA